MLERFSECHGYRSRRDRTQRIRRSGRECRAVRRFREHDMSEWIERLSAAGIPCSPVRSFAEVVADPQTAVREMFPTVDGHRVTGPPVKLSGTPACVGPGAPELGEQTGAVLSELL